MLDQQVSVGLNPDTDRPPLRFKLGVEGLALCVSIHGEYPAQFTEASRSSRSR